MSKFFEDVQKLSYELFNKVVVLKDENVSTTPTPDVFVNKPFIIKDWNKFDPITLNLTVKTLEGYFVLPSEVKRTFYKKWKTVLGKTRTEIALDQFLHYFTTYGLGLQGDDVYYPESVQEIFQEFKELKVIDVFPSLEDFVQALQGTLKQNIALSNLDLLTDVIDGLLRKGFLNETIIDTVGNKEVKRYLMDILDILPSDPDEFMELLIYKITGDTLVVKNRDLVTKIEWDCPVNIVLPLLRRYRTEKLAEVFNRWKKVLLAIKLGCNHGEVSRIINKVSKLSKKYHKPKGIPTYQQLTALYESGRFGVEEVLNEAKKLDTSYLIKLRNAFAFRSGSDYCIYRIRNGKVYYKPKSSAWNVDFDIVVIKLTELIQQRIQNNINKYKVVLEQIDGIDLVVPTSGKQFFANVPEGSLIRSPYKDLVVGISWYNYDGKSVDLDLSLTSFEGKIGWDSVWVSKKDSIVFSGDVTDARRGATEAFWISHPSIFYTLKVNFYNRGYFGDIDLPYKFFISTTSKDKIKRKKNPMIDVNEIIFQTQDILSERAKIIGCCFENYFAFVNLQSLKQLCTADLDSSEFYDTLRHRIMSYLRFLDLKLESYTPKSEDEEVLTLNFKNPSKDLLLKLVG